MPYVWPLTPSLTSTHPTDINQAAGGFRRARTSRPPAPPKLAPFVGIIDQILEDGKGRPAEQRHTSKRIFERLRDEHG